MTDLALRSTKLRFVTASEVREGSKWRRVVCEARPGYLIVKASGLHSCYTIDYASIWSMAVKMQVAAEKAEKKAAKKGKQ
jgi:hypothetical protein